MKTTQFSLIYGMLLTLLLLIISCKNEPKPLPTGLLLSMNFESNTLENTDGGSIEYTSGVQGKSLDLANSSGIPPLKNLGTEWFTDSKDFSISVWVKAAKAAQDTTIILSNANFRTKKMGIYGMRRINKGFTLSSSNGGWSWNIGNGGAFYNYEPIAQDQPIADNKWHQLVFTYNALRREVRLFHDGVNRAIFSLGDLKNRNFTSDTPLVIGGSKKSTGYDSFTGSMDELQVWETMLSDEEVKESYKAYAKLKAEPKFNKEELTVLNWNIWHGGSHYLKERDGFDGVERIVEMIKGSGADIVLMQETYGAGSIISSSLGYYYYEASSAIGAVWGANLSVMSRYPIEDVYMNENPSNYGKNYAFNNGGAKIRLTKNHKLIAFSNWYNGDKPEDLEGALKGWDELVTNADNIPIIWAGDFNSVSHLDDGIGKSGHSKLMTNAGFKDSYRALYPDAKKHPCYSSPRNEDRIDFIYYKGATLELIEAGKIIENFKGKGNTPGYPSDHLGLTSKFNIN